MYYEINMYMQIIQNNKKNNNVIFYFLLTIYYTIISIDVQMYHKEFRLILNICFLHQNWDFSIMAI